MEARIGDGTKFVRDFAADFTDKETYIGGKAFPKGYFTVALLNYGKEVTTRLVEAGGYCYQGIRAITLQMFTLEQFDALAEVILNLHKELAELEPFCYLDILEEAGLLESLFSDDIRKDLEKYYDLAQKYSDCNRAALELSKEELCIERNGMILESCLLELFRSYGYFCTDAANFTTVIMNFEYMNLWNLEKRNASTFARAWNEFFSDPDLRLALMATQPTLSMAGFSEEAVVATKMVVIPGQKGGTVTFARRYRFNRIMGFLVMDFFEGLQAGHSPRQCEICQRYFHMTDGRQQRYCNGYAPGDPKHRTCQAVAARMGREEREKADDHPVKAVCNRRCNTIDHHLREHKLDQEFAATAKRIARGKRDWALRDNDYFLYQYEAEMTQEAIYAQTEQQLGRPPRREELCAM